MANFSNKVKGKEIGSAATYAVPHTMTGKKITGSEAMENGVYSREKSAKTASIKDPIKSGVSYGTCEIKTDGIEMRGAGAATKGRMSRGPMA